MSASFIPLEIDLLNLNNTKASSVCGTLVEHESTRGIFCRFRAFPIFGKLSTDNGSGLVFVNRGLLIELLRF